MDEFTPAGTRTPEVGAEKLPVQPIPATAFIAIFRNPFPVSALAIAFLRRGIVSFSGDGPAGRQFGRMQFIRPGNERAGRLPNLAVGCPMAEPTPPTDLQRCLDLLRKGDPQAQAALLEHACEHCAVEPEDAQAVP